MKRVHTCVALEELRVYYALVILQNFMQHKSSFLLVGAEQNSNFDGQLNRFYLFLYSTKYVNIKSTTVYVPSSELGLSQPLSRQRVVPLPPEPGGAHSPAGEGLGESQFRRLEKKLSTLPTLCYAPLSSSTCVQRGKQIDDLMYLPSVSYLQLSACRHIHPPLFLSITVHTQGTIPLPMDEGALKTPIPKCCLYKSFLFGVVK